MAIRKILTIGDELLRKKSKPVESFDSRLHVLLDDMYDTMKKNAGAGLSAVQVGVLRRVFITEIEGELIEFINPIILSQSGKNKFIYEGCLSVPNKSGPVDRPNIVTVKAQDRHGNEFTYTGKAFQAKAICHEYDHLDGILYVDRIAPNKKLKDD